MQIIPVLDLLGGVVVRGLAGQRDSYRPISSQLVNSAEPLAVARAFQQTLGLKRFYVADLDAIERDRPAIDILSALAGEGRELLVDAGLRDLDRATLLFEHGASGVIAGLETLSGPKLLEKLVTAVGPQRLLFSLDLMHGRPLVDTTAWQTDDPHALARRAISAGIGQLIILDLAGVGTNQGPPTLPLCRDLRQHFPDLQLITGGGIRHQADIDAAEQAGVDAVLVASALHDGRIDPRSFEPSDVQETPWPKGASPGESGGSSTA